MTHKVPASFWWILISSSVLMLISLTTGIMNISLDRPLWLIIFSFVPVPVVLLLIVTSIIDLIKGNQVICGVLNEKKDIVNGYRLHIRQDGSERLQTFRMNLRFTEALADLQIGESIEVRYYKLTRIVVDVRKFQ
ncbi:hypothetical protein [Paenibacillus kobensis]|uniref:hypothetical protein n=1 Tax=Paenibacillus kobensis TaxID=59841 RepID=UPI000FD9C35D|nr:hypothetical protein [Paenibacillus kobensis]